MLIITTISLLLLSLYFDVEAMENDAVNAGCTDRQDFFNRRYFHLSQNSLSYECQYRRRRRHSVHLFDVEDVVRCFDSLSAKRHRKPMHIAFIGDSIIRLHFINFLRLLPDYDRQLASPSNRFPYNGFQEDRNVTFPLMDDLLVSFRWRPRIDEEIFQDFHRWWSNNPAADNAELKVPDFILIGIILIGTTAHYLVRYDDEEHAPSFEYFQIMLDKYLVPWMNRNLESNPNQQIVWLYQSWPGNYRGPEHQYHSQWVNSDKIEFYNRNIRRILNGSKRRIAIWDSINEIVDEIIRSCSLTRVLRQDVKHYSNCGDFFHPGFGGLSLGSHLILNNLCANI